jgi:hypothetical protein
MIDFVAYFSTAQDQVGYVIIDGHGNVAADAFAGPRLPEGTYRVEAGALVQIDAGAPHQEAQALESRPETGLEPGAPSE